MTKVLKPILLTFLTSNAVKHLIVELLEAMVKETDNTLDDVAVAAVRTALLPKEVY